MKKKTIKLIYLVESKRINASWQTLYGIDGRMWNLSVPRDHVLYGYNNSTRTLDGLKELGIIPGGLQLC